MFILPFLVHLVWIVNVPESPFLTLGSETGYPEVLVVLQSSSERILVQYQNTGYDRFLAHRFQMINHP
jgi:hypothetical protein